MLTVAVTGASGFIGSHVVKQLLQRGYTVHATVRNSADPVKTAHLRKLDTVGGKLKLFSADLDVLGSFDLAFQGVDVVVHTAAEVDITNENPEKVVNASTKGSDNVLDSIVRSKSVKRLVHTSSVAAIVRTDYPEGYCFTEADYNTHSTVANGESYGFAKYMAEKLVVDRCKAIDLDLVVINPVYVLGECLTKAHTKASPLFVRNLLYGKQIPNLWCTFVDVTDVAKAHVEGVDNAKAVGHRFVLAGDNALSMSELGSTCKHVRPDLPWPQEPKVFDLDSQKKYTFDNTQSKQILGIKYATVPEMVKTTIASMLDTGFVALKLPSKL